MGANGRGAVRIGGAQAELHPRGDVVCGPMRGSIFDHGRDRALECSGRIGGAGPDVALVEVGMRVEEQRQNNPARQRQARGLAEEVERRWAPCRRSGPDRSGYRPGSIRRGPPAQRRTARARAGHALRRGHSVASSRSRTPNSRLAGPRAVVPAMQQQMRERAEGDEDRDARDRDQQQRREHARNVEPVARIRRCETRDPRLGPRIPPRFQRRWRRSAPSRRRCAGRQGNRAATRECAATAIAASARRGRAERDRRGYGPPRTGRARYWRVSGRKRPETRRPAPPRPKSDRPAAAARWR